MGVSSGLYPQKPFTASFVWCYPIEVNSTTVLIEDISLIDSEQHPENKS
jgi:hypothetical protein